jgi:hypothetical protein
MFCGGNDDFLDRGVKGDNIGGILPRQEEELSRRLRNRYRFDTNFGDLAVNEMVRDTEHDLGRAGQSRNND